MQVHFHFESQLLPDDKVFPKAMQRLISDLSVQELELAFVHGRWVIQLLAAKVATSGNTYEIQPCRLTRSF